MTGLNTYRLRLPTPVARRLSGARDSFVSGVGRRRPTERHRRESEACLDVDWVHLLGACSERLYPALAVEIDRRPVAQSFVCGVSTPAVVVCHPSRTRKSSIETSKTRRRSVRRASTRTVVENAAGYVNHVRVGRHIKAKLTKKIKNCSICIRFTVDFNDLDSTSRRRRHHV